MKRVIAVDFDGTLCENRYPEIGEPNTELIEQLIEEQKNGAAIILYTCRARKRLAEAVKWSQEHGLQFDEVNRNINERIRMFHGDTRKISADVYIDDRAVAFSYGKRLNMAGSADAGDKA